MAKRIFDIILSAALVFCLSPLMLIVGILIKLDSKGPILHLSLRIGKNNRVFRMYKFRTMQTDAPHIAKHLMLDPSKYVTSLGKFLRKSSLDELPQLFNVLKGEMSFVGPRPALYNQHDLIQYRTEKRVHELLPGITGLAQINGRDTIMIPSKVEWDEYYLKNKSFWLDTKIITKTVLNVIVRKDISH